MKYLGDLFRISIFVFIMYLPLAWFSIQESLQTIHQIRNENVVHNLLKVRASVVLLLQEDRLLEACQKLKAEFEAQSIVSYTLISNEGRCHELIETLPPVKTIGAVESFNVKGHLLNFIREKTRSTDWSIAVPTPLKINFFDELKQNSALRRALLIDILVVIYIIFAFVFCAVLILAKSIQNQYRKNGKDPKWLKFINMTFGKIQLHDLKIVKTATETLIKKNESLIQDRDLLETSLEFSILNEIRENKFNIPYSFIGTVAKVDINGFSKVISKANLKETQNLTKILEDYGCELLQRYNGLFEKTVGDEIVVVFKSQDSALLATAFSRDLMQEFSKINFIFQDENRKFTLKSSISTSEITFSKRAPGFGFLGDALTYTTRLLDVVHIKDRNILSCLKSQSEGINDLVFLPDEFKLFEFKNMQAQECYLIDQFLTIEMAYENKQHLLKYFRSDESLIYLLNKFKIETNPEKLNLIVSCFSKVHVRICHSQFVTTWVETLKIFEKRVHENSELSLLFSRLIMEGGRLIPSSDWTTECTTAIVEISRHIEGRINASIVDLLIEKDLNLFVIENEKSFFIDSDPSFRTRGNLLINQALYQLSDSVFDKVIRMINSNNPLESNTGIYCACRIIIYYQKEQPAELETYNQFKKLTKILDRIKNKKNKKTSTRLLNLIEKMSDFANQKHQDVNL